MKRILSLAALALFVPALLAQDKDGFTPLFNGKDLAGFYTYLRGTGKNNDPEKVVTVHDGMVHVSGKVSVRIGNLMEQPVRVGSSLRLAGWKRPRQRLD